VERVVFNALDEWIRQYPLIFAPSAIGWHRLEDKPIHLFHAVFSTAE
jgi:hypothetical protein